jgi:Fe-S-cluster containining protein
VTRRSGRSNRAPRDASNARAEEAELLAELGRLYSEADSVYAGWGCPASTECCRFGITGREPYVTSIELLAVRRAAAALGGPKAWKRAAPLSLSLSLPMASRGDERTCPMLTTEGRCAVYASRPFGCRTFYCDRAVSGGTVKHKDITALVRRLKDLAERHEAGGDLGRPLTKALTGAGT